MSLVPSLPLAGRVALVTGAAERVGRITATNLAAAGADILVNHLGTPGAATSTRLEIEGLGRRCAVIEADISDPAACRELVTHTVDVLGRLDILVNNASTFVERPLLEVTEDDFDAAFAVNIKGPFFLSQAAACVMLEQGGGKIIAMIGESYHESWPNFAAHCCSKVALAKLVQVLAVALAPTVQCIGVAPASVLPPESGSDRTLAKSRGEQWHDPESVLGRLRAGTPADVAELITYLAGSTPYLTGTVITIDGGKSAV